MERPIYILLEHAPKMYLARDSAESLDSLTGGTTKKQIKGIRKTLSATIVKNFMRILRNRSQRSYYPNALLLRSAQRVHVLMHNFFVLHGTSGALVTLRFPLCSLFSICIKTTSIYTKPFFNAQENGVYQSSLSKS